jgi:hypothetical protein
MGAGRGVLLKNWPRKDSVGSVMRLNRRWRLRSSHEIIQRLFGTRQDAGPGDERRRSQFRSNGVVISLCRGPPGCATRLTGSRVLCSAAWQERWISTADTTLLLSRPTCADWEHPGFGNQHDPWVVLGDSTHLGRSRPTQFGWRSEEECSVKTIDLCSWILDPPPQRKDLHQGRESAVQRLGDTAPETNQRLSAASLRQRLGPACIVTRTGVCPPTGKGGPWRDGPAVGEPVMLDWQTIAFLCRGGSPETLLQAVCVLAGTSTHQRARASGPAG